jgi:tetratricopeptide (TPR) repeat protein
VRGAEEPLIDRAWEEYRLQNFSAAEDLFNQVLQHRQSGAEEILQARIGAAMVEHYRMPANNPENAAEQYEAILDSLPQRHALYPNIELLAGRAWINTKNETFFDRAKIHFQSVYDRHNGAIEAREAILELAFIELLSVEQSSLHAAITMIENDLNRYPDNPFASSMHAFCSSIALALNDHKRSRQHNIERYHSGIPNRNSIPSVLFQIAYISETMLQDTATAIEYYQELIDTTLDDGRRNFCKMKIEQFGGGNNE